MNDPANPRPPLSFLLIEDSRQDAELTRIYLREVVRGVELHHLRQPPADLAEIDAHSGVVVDQNLGGALGVNVAREIHARDWTKPVMILTGAPMTDPDLIAAYEYAWIVASKNDLARSVSKFRAFARMCAVARAVPTGKTQP